MLRNKFTTSTFLSQAAGGGSGGGQMTPAQQNQLARQLIQSQGLDMCQQIFSYTGAPSTNNVITIVPRNVGLLRGFWVEINATMYGSAASGALTPFGPANLLSQIVFFDLNNNVRHQTTGWHVAFIDSIRKGYPYSQGFTVPGPIGYGPNFAPSVVEAPTELPATAPGSPNVRMLYYIPISYTKDDLRGAIYMGVTNATASLQLTLNTSGAFVATGADPTGAIYQNATNPEWSSVTVNVYQDYIDQLPVGSNGAPILPLTDLSTVYELKSTTLTSMVANQDFPIPYSNFRSFLSTFMVFDNGGTLNTGSDVNYLGLQAANFTFMLKTDAGLWSSWTRDMLQTDFPDGVYYLDTRRKPLNTNQYGNLQLILNASTVNANAVVLMGYEDFALINTIQLAQSLPAS
jgi:hypothetical protein